MRNVGVVNNAANMIPVAGSSNVTVAVTSSAQVVISVDLDSSTQALMWTVDGGTARVWFNGDDPTASAGLLLTDGSAGTWSRRTAEKAKIIIATSSPVFHAEQMTY